MALRGQVHDYIGREIEENRADALDVADVFQRFDDAAQLPFKDTGN